MKQPDASIVRVTKAEGKTLGTGFILSANGLIVTCAHVVEGTKPYVAFPDGEPRPTQVVTTDDVHDVAILQLHGELPEDAEPARLGESIDVYHRDFWSRGYRPLGEMAGIPAEGRVLHAVSECPGVDHMPLILTSQNIRKGMSGAPVYIPDWDVVVAMITDYWDSLAYWKKLEERGKTGTPFPDRDTALATPAEAIAALCPDIHFLEPPPEFSRPPIGVPFQPPAVPRYFVPRPEVSNDLKTRLLADETTAPGALVVSAVHGLGGIGKTTLVAALAHDPDLQARFPDGILWATLGHKPEVLSLLVGWIQALRDYDFRPTVVESASNHLRTLLHDKACLLVVDDAWQADHVRAFLVGGERCRVLVTTRDATLARKVGARLYDLDVMTEAQALALFEARLGPLNGHRDQAAALARELGYLPLALELAAAQVEAGYSWDELLDTFRQGLADLAALDLDEATYRNESLCLSFSLSLDGLPPDGRGGLSPNDRQAFIWLGVLSEDAFLSPTMTATLWDQPEAEARKRLRCLRDKALLKPAGDDQYTIHDLLHDEAKLRLVKRMPLPEAHAALLKRYRARIQRGLWHTLSDDGYIHERLTWHMEQAGQPKAIHALLREETPDGRNGWYQARDRLGLITGYLADVVRAWRLAGEEFALGLSLLSIGLQCRYALITASINSLAKNIPPALLVALVEKGVWTPSQGLAYACQVPDPKQRGEALTDLAPYLSQALLREALVAAQAIEEKTRRAHTLAGLVPHLLEGERAEALREAMVTASEIGSKEGEWVQASTLVRLAPRLSYGPLSNEALAMARGIQDEYYRVMALAGLAPHLPEPLKGEALQEVLAAVPIMANDRIGAETLAELTPHLPEPLLQKALESAQKIRGEEFRAQALCELVPYLPEPLLQEVFLTTKTIDHEYSRTRVLMTLAPHVSEELWEEMLRAGREIEHRGYRADVLLELVPHLPELLKREAIAEILAVAQEIKDEGHRVATLAEVAPYLPEPSRREALWGALATARTIESGMHRARVLAWLAPRLSKLPIAEALREALAAASMIEYADHRAESLIELVPCLPEPLRQEAQCAVLEAVQKIREEATQAETLAQLAHHLPEPLQEHILRRALAIVQRMRRGARREEVLDKLVPDLPEPLLREALAISLAILDEFERTRVLAGLMFHLPRSVREEALPEVLQAALQVRDADYRAYALAKLAPHLTEPLMQDALASAQDLPIRPFISQRAVAMAALALRLAELGYPEQALTVVQDILDEHDGTEALVRLAPYLSEPLLRQALTAARGIGYESFRAEALVGLVPYLPEPLRQEAVREALAATWRVTTDYRSKALAAVAPYLSEPLLQEALACAQEIPGLHHQVKALAVLAPYLPESLLQDVLAAARVMQSEAYRAQVLVVLAPHLSEPLKGQVLEEALAAVREIQDRYDWARMLAVQVLARLAPHFPEPSRREVLREALAATHEIESERDRVRALVALAPQLSEQLLEEVLAVVRDIPEEDDRAMVLVELCPRLAELGHFEEALVTARALPEQTIRHESPRTEALVKVAPHLPDSLLQEELAIVPEIREAWQRRPVLVRLVPRLCALPTAILYPLWQEALHALVRHTRTNLLSDLGALAPVIAKLGGEEAITETFRAIQDVGRWWP